MSSSHPEKVLEALGFDEARIREAMHDCYQFAEAASDDPDTWNEARILTVFTEGDVISACAAAFSSNCIVDQAVFAGSTENARKDLRAKHPLKRIWMEHAERAAIYGSRLRRVGFHADEGVEVLAHVMVCPWFSCPDCARAIVLSGITAVVGHLPAHERTPPRWREAIAAGDEILERNGVTIYRYPGRLGGGLRARLDGQDWEP